jgi:FkbH-like protein
MKDFNSLKKNLLKDSSDLKKIKIAVLGDSATQFLTQVLKGHGYEAGLNVELYEAEPEQIELQILNPSSELYKFVPDYIIVFCSTQKLKNKFYRSTKADKLIFAESHIQWVEELYTRLSQKLTAKVIYMNFPELDDSVFGNYSNKTELSFIYQLRKINYSLMNLSVKLKNLLIGDLSILQKLHGRKGSFDPKMYVNADIVMSIDLLPFVAKSITDIILSTSGRFSKCLILDLDNTIWGGTIGDDGIEHIQIGNLGIGKAFTEIQSWIKQLKDRGILLAVCSKNEEVVAKEAFDKHPDMVLRTDDIAVFVANWNNKADNIRHIQSILNIGFDSMVFLDDDQFERNMVREHIPEITVPELPEDPAEYLEYLQTLNLFEKRTEQYSNEVARSIEQKNHTDENSFLAGLNMISVTKPFDKFNNPRIHQLMQRSNQFNLRTIRYSEEEIEKLAISNDHITFTFNLSDKYGDNGLISVVVLKKQNKDTLFIDSWLMSCRVLKRGTEEFTLNTIVKYAKEKGFKKITGEYIPTAKNGMVKDLYLNMGFTLREGLWLLNIDKYREKANFITAR